MDKIEEQIRQIDWRDYDQVIDFYESNRLYFDNFETLKNQDKITQFIDVKLHYANSLFDKSLYDKVLPVLDQVKELLEKLDKDHWNRKESDQHRRFLLGMILGHKKKFKESYQIFDQLVKENPDHHYYKVWYTHTKIGLYNWIFNGLLILGVVLILANLLFTLDEKLPIDLGLVGLVILGITFIAQKGLNEYYKRKRTATNKN